MLILVNGMRTRTVETSCVSELLILIVLLGIEHLEQTTDL